MEDRKRRDISDILLRNGTTDEHGGYLMEEQTSIKKIMNEIEQLDYADRIRLVESIMRTLRVRESVSRERKKGGDPEAVFGL